MSKRSRLEMRQRRHTMRWRHWELLRWCKDYKEAVEHFLAATRELSRDWGARRPSHPDLPVSIDSQMFRDYYARLQECVGHINACQKIVEIYERLARRLGTELTQKECEALNAGHGQDYEALQREVLALVERCLSSNLWGCADLIWEFQERWKVRFPLDPSLPAVVWELLLPFPDVAVRLLSWRAEAATVEVRLAVSRERLHKDLDMHLDALEQSSSTQPRTGRGKDNFQGIPETDKEYYIESIRAYALRQKDIPALTIAEELWPQEVERDRRRHANVADFPSVQKVYDRVKRITELMEEIKK